MRQALEEANEAYIEEKIETAAERMANAAEVGLNG
jgi:hypothetical protein